MSKTRDKTYRGLIKNTFKALTKGSRKKKRLLKIFESRPNISFKRYLGASLICSSNIPIFNSENKNSNI